MVGMYKHPGLLHLILLWIIVFVNNANVNGDGTTVASGTTTYRTTAQFSVGTTVTIRVRATATYWSEVVMGTITVRGEYLLQNK